MISFFANGIWENAILLLVGWGGMVPLVYWMVAEPSQAWEHVPGEPVGRNYYPEKGAKCWKSALCYEQEGRFLWVKPLTFWNLSFRVTSIILTPFHRNSRANRLKSELGIITVGSSRLKASFKRWTWDWDWIEQGLYPHGRIYTSKDTRPGDWTHTEETVSRYVVPWYQDGSLPKGRH